MNIVVNGYIIKIGEVNPGGQETVFFLHGWPLSHKMFEYQWRELAEKGIRCIGMDIIGFGGSSKPSSGYDYDNLAMLLDGVLRELNLNGITLLGFSMGGAIAARYLSNYGTERVKKLILLGAACPSFVRREDFLYGNDIETVDLLIKNVINDKPEAFAKFTDLVFDTGISPEFANWFNNMANETAIWSAQKCLESLRDEDLRQDLDRISIPTAIFHGVNDRVCPFALAEQMNLRLANSFILPFDYSGHGIFYEERDKLNMAISDFVTDSFNYPLPLQNQTIRTAEEVPVQDSAIKQKYKYSNKPLPYAYNALEPYVDEKTMHLHHDAHLQKYIDNLNKVLERYPELHNWTLEELLSQPIRLPSEVKTQIERNAGGVYNHFFFFDGLSAQKSKASAALTAVINRSFGSMQNFETRLIDAAMGVFGSGYAWLVIDRNRKLEIITTTGQETPLALGKKPILNIDVWEHAYYLKYYNNRLEYIKGILNVVNWRAIEFRLM